MWKYNKKKNELNVSLMNALKALVNQTLIKFSNIKLEKLKKHKRQSKRKKKKPKK